MVKSKEMLEIRWHGRGGMGAKTAALLLGEAMIHQGKYIQAFPEYGPERRGAPVTSYNRISDNPIKIHYGIKEPDVVMVLDPTLLQTERVREGLNEDTILIVNSKMQPEEIKKKFNINAKVYTVDATGISEEILGRNLPNTPMLGALVRVTGLIDFDTFLKAVEERLKVKYKENIVKGNLKAIKKAYEEVKGL
ncbi:MAG: pyruvate synthase [Candidatus Hydrothermota bacterium]|nr:MAG: pyruvate synthase [Candidatus Hydrothermae bacterium]